MSRNAAGRNFISQHLYLLQVEEDDDDDDDDELGDDVDVEED